MLRSLLPFFAFLFLTLPVTAQITAVKAGKLVDPETGTVTVNQIILIEKQKITEVGPNLTIPKDAKVIDLSGSVVLPGLMDAHTHLCTVAPSDRLDGDFWVTAVLDQDSFRAIQGVAHAREMLEAGFTTVRDVGNSGKYVDVSLRRAISEGLVPGPTIICAGRIIAPFGGQFSLKVDKPLLDNPEYFFADTPDELRKAIRENIFYGSQVIKLVVDGQKYMYSTEDLKFIVAEAARAGVKVAAHCQTKQGGHNAAEAGVASIEHGWFLDDEDFALMKKNNVTLVGTDFTEKVLRGFGWDEANAKRIHGRRVDRLKRAYQAGVTIAFGADVMVRMEGETLGTLTIGYVDSFVEAGVPPKDILKAMTTNAARLLGVEKERGWVKAGQFADLIAVPENPLDNIQTLKKVSFVMKNGKVVKQ
ncbi:MAG: amidohydrolase family protein [Blastocatellia bacterium]|nr:amidohydrolase family protein [Blastocatellia bacterium]